MGDEIRDAVRRENDKNIVDLGVTNIDGRRVELELNPCQQAMAQLKQADIPLYEVGALQEGAKDLDDQVRQLREKANKLEEQAGEYRVLAKMCERRDRELADKGMYLRDGRIRLIDGDHVQQGH